MKARLTQNTRAPARTRQLAASLRAHGKLAEDVQGGSNIWQNIIIEQTKDKDRKRKNNVGE